MLEAIVAAALLAADQITKYLTDIHLSPLGTSVPVWEGVFHFTSVHNTGSAFGMLPGAKWFFVTATLVAVGAILWLLIKKRPLLHTLIRLSLALILAGALGNFIDRLAFGYVRDMLDFRLIHFPVFNVADVAICLGTGLMLLDILFLPKGRALMKALDAKPAPGGEEAAEITEPEGAESQIAEESDGGEGNPPA